MRHYPKGFAAVFLLGALLWAIAPGAVQGTGPPVVFDADAGPGYQGATVAPAAGAGAVVALEIFGRGVEGASGFSAAIRYDPNRVAFAGFDAGDLIPGLTGLIVDEDAAGTVEVGGASVTGAAVRDRGVLGVVRFEIVSEDGPTEVTITRASLTGPDGQTDYDVASTVVIGGAPAYPVVLDADPNPGYHGASHVEMVEPGQVIALELVGGQMMGAAGFSATIRYDPDEVAFAGFSAGDLIPGLTGLVIDEGAGTVEVGGASVEGVAMRPGGSLGVVRFEVASGFSGGTRISVTKATVAWPDGAVDYAVESPVAIGEVGEAPIGPPAGTRGPIALDMDPAAGDQGQWQTATAPKAGDTVTIDVAAVSGAQGNTGFQVRLKYDPDQLEWVEFQKQDIFAGGMYIPSDPVDGVAEASLAILGGTASMDAGSMGHAIFRVLPGFTGQTRVELIFASYDQPVEVGSGGAYVVIGGAGPAKPTPDFDGDGQVGFTDFIMFAQVFGASQGDAKFDAKFDLDGDGTIGFTDFIQFAQAFGKPAGGKPARLSKPAGMVPGVNGNAAVSLVPVSGEFYVMAVQLSDVVALQGYEMVLRYDPAALQFVEARRPADGMLNRAGRTPLFLARETGPGEVILADAIVDEGRASGSGVVAEIVFRQIAGGAEGAVVVETARLFDGAGGMDLLGADARSGPPAYALSQNFPNPFNPETQIAYSIPEEADVRIAVYDVTGQFVRELVQGAHGPGHYRVVWDARDAAGREVASGVYLYRLEAGGVRLAHKMLLVR